MACRIGITTNPNKRREEWKREHPSLHGWKILAEYGTKTAAQAAETRLARQHGCEASPGGRGAEIGKRIVYKFGYDLAAGRGMSIAEALSGVGRNWPLTAGRGMSIAEALSGARRNFALTASRGMSIAEALSGARRNFALAASREMSIAEALSGVGRNWPLAASREMSVAQALQQKNNGSNSPRR